MATPIIHGPAYSTYTRTARLALEEKGIAYQLDEVDMLAGAAKKPDHLARQPFGRVPAFTHDDLSLYETAAIARYADEAFPGPKLQPADVKRRARMMQIISIIDSYAYGSCIGIVPAIEIPTAGSFVGSQPEFNAVRRDLARRLTSHMSPVRTLESVV